MENASNKSERVFRNASWIIACRVVQAVINLLISMLTARYLGPSNFGVINYASSIVAFAAPIMYLGFNSVLVQKLVSDPQNEGKYLGSSIILSVCSSFLCMAGIAAFVTVANPGESETLIVCVLYSILLVFQALDLIQYWFQAKLISKYASIVMLIAYAISALYKAFLLIAQKNIRWFALAQVIEYAIISVSLLIIYRKKGGKKLSFSRETSKRLFQVSKYFIVSSMMVTVFGQISRIMLKIMVDDATTGYYSAAITTAGMTSFIFAAIIDSMRPMIFESKKLDNQQYEMNISRLYCIIIYLSLAQSVFMTALAPFLVNILYGAAYENTVPILRILVWYTTFSYMGSVRSIWILAEDKQKYLWIINMSGALVNIALNFLLIPRYQGVGAAIAAFVTQVFTNLIIGYIIKPIYYNNKLIVKGLNIVKLFGFAGEMIKKKISKRS